MQVLGSRDGSDWHTLVENAVLFDYSRYMDVNNREISVPPNDDRHFRITIETAAI